MHMYLFAAPYKKKSYICLYIKILCVYMYTYKQNLNVNCYCLLHCIVFPSHGESSHGGRDFDWCAEKDYNNFKQEAAMM